MSKDNVEPFTFRFLMPKRFDFSGQVDRTFKHIGFDKKGLIDDPETKTPLIDLVKCIPEETIKKFLWILQLQNKEVRDWLRHLFATDYQRLSERKPEVYWRYIFYFPETDLFSANPELFNEKFTSDRHGPHIAVGQRDDLTVLRIKEATFEDLFKKTREKISAALELI